MNRKDLLTLGGCILICLLPGSAGSLFTAPAIDSWYRFLEKPFFTPPSWLFGPVWTALYIMMGISLFLIWKGTGAAFEDRRKALKTFIVQLLLNASWSPVFFGIPSIAGGLVIIVALLFFIALTIYNASKVSSTAALLLVPYFVWVSYASVLNLSIFILNR